MELKLAAAGNTTKSPDVLEYSSPQRSFKACGNRWPPPLASPVAANPGPILRSPTIAVKPKSRFVELNYPSPSKFVTFDDTATTGAGITTNSTRKRISNNDSNSDWDEWRKENEAATAE